MIVTVCTYAQLVKCAVASETDGAVVTTTMTCSKKRRSKPFSCILAVSARTASEHVAPNSENSCTLQKSKTENLDPTRPIGVGEYRYPTRGSTLSPTTDKNLESYS
jgi:hypothetical protein